MLPALPPLASTKFEHRISKFEDHTIGICQANDHPTPVYFSQRIEISLILSDENGQVFGKLADNSLFT
jgi:hypothetical protein